MWAGPPAANIVNTTAGLIVAALVIAALSLGRDFLIPFTLAGLFSFALQPAVRWLDDHKLPRPAAVVLVVLSLLAATGTVGTFLALEVSAFAEELPRYETNLRSKIREVTSRFEGAGIWQTASRVLRNVEAEIKEPPQSGNPVKVEVQNEHSSPFAAFLTYLQLSILPLTSAGLALLFTVFILLQYHDLRDRIVRVMGLAEIGRSTQALNDAALELSHFFRLQAGLNLSFGVVIGISLWAIGIPNAALWGALAAILRFVPYIGGVLSAVLPLALAAAVEPGWTKLLLTAALFGVAEFVTAQVIEPLLFGSKTRLSPLAVLLSAAFWTSIWGPVGLLLAMPITLSLVVFADRVPLLSYIGVLLGNTPALGSDQRLYHLLLAEDAASAVEDMEEWLGKDRPLIDYLDEVAIPALSIATKDTARDVLRPDQLDKLKQAADEFVELAEDLVEQRLQEQKKNAVAERPLSKGAERPFSKALIIPARGAFDQAAGKLVALAGRLEARVDVTLAVGGLMGINATLQDRDIEDFNYAAIVSVGEATPSQLRLLIRRLSRTLSVPIGVLMGRENNDVQRIDGEILQANVFGSSKALLGKIKAAADSPSGPNSEPVPLQPAMSARLAGVSDKRPL